MFKPEFFYWRLVLIVRKAGFASVAMLFSRSASFQAWYVWFCLNLVFGGKVGLLVVTYSLEIPGTCVGCVCVSCTTDSLCVGILFACYVLHAKYQPFLDKLDLDNDVDDMDRYNREGAVLNYVRFGIVLHHGPV